MKNIKDKLTTLAGFLIAVCGAVAVLPTQGIALPTWATPAMTITVTLCGAVIAFLTGKNPDGSRKTKDQIEAQNRGEHR